MNWVTSDFLRSHLLLTLVLEVQRWKLFASSLQESLSKTWGRKNRIRTPYEKADLFSTITIYESLLILPSLGILNVQQKLSEAPNSKSPKVPKRILYSLHCWRWSVSLQLKKKKKMTDDSLPSCSPTMISSPCRHCLVSKQATSTRICQQTYLYYQYFLQKGLNVPDISPLLPSKRPRYTWLKQTSSLLLGQRLPQHAAGSGRILLVTQGCVTDSDFLQMLS